mgnify:CR=1 FL=1
MFNYNGLGCMPGRTWVIAPDKQTLEQRWNILIYERNPDKKERLFHPHPKGDRSLVKVPNTREVKKPRLSFTTIGVFLIFST